MLESKKKMIEIYTHWSRYGNVCYKLDIRGKTKTFNSMEELNEYLKHDRATNTKTNN